MTKAIERDAIYRGRRYSAETIELCIRWYISYRLSYRDLATMMAERDVIVSHTTIMRWVLRYVPEYERRWSRFARPPGTSWRVDETAVAVRGGRHYLFRGVDKNGKSIGSLLCSDRDKESAQAFFRAAVADGRVPWPAKINIDGNKATLRGLRLLGNEDHRWRQVEVRASRYLNNVVEQDHRVIKQRCASMLGLKSFPSAAVTLAGIELAHRIRKGQHRLPLRGEVRQQPSLKQMWDCALNRSSEPILVDGNCDPPMHQISRRAKRERAEEFLKSEFPPVRYLRKISFGGSLNLFITPKGGRYWRYCYRYGGKRRTLSLGLYPEVPVDSARSRHLAARQLLAAGVDPSLKREQLRGTFRLRRS
jgi:transposase-like protein